jgi:hypothetical protein
MCPFRASLLLLKRLPRLTVAAIAWRRFAPGEPDHYPPVTEQGRFFFEDFISIGS